MIKFYNQNNKQNENDKEKKLAKEIDQKKLADSRYKIKNNFIQP